MTFVSGDALASILIGAVEDGGNVRITREDHHVLKLYAELKWPGRQDSVHAPFEVKEALRRYVQEACFPGEFLYGVLTRDLATVMSHADAQSLFYLQAIYKYAYNVIPAMCHGSKAGVDAFLGGSGLPDWTPKY